MKAMTYLLQVYKLEQMIERKKSEAAYWKGMAGNTSIPTDSEPVQTSSGKQKMADCVDKYVDLNAEIYADTCRLMDIRQEVINTIRLLEAVEYNVLFEKYILHKCYKEIAVTHGKSYSWVTTTRGRAIKNLQKILDRRSKI